LEGVKERILSKDEKLFEGIPGIGRKKAMAIMLELTGKIRDIPKKSVKLSGTSSDEAEEALIGLGFSREKTKAALAKIPKDVKDVEERTKQALKILGR
jgi:Holliday junction resolvasome RuvABC DNA-binding subunit